jgi:hypothetical protein
VDPKLYRPPVPSVVVELTAEQAHEAEQVKLRQELADQLEAMDKELPTPEWLRPL